MALNTFKTGDTVRVNGAVGVIKTWNDNHNGLFTLETALPNGGVDEWTLHIANTAVDHVDLPAEDAAALDAVVDLDAAPTQTVTPKRQRR